MKKGILGISVLTLSVLYGLLAAIIILVFLLTGGDVLYGIGISLVVLLIEFLISPWLTDLSMKWFYKAQFGETIPDYLKEFIENECKLHDVKYPQIAIIHDGAPNAFTYGRTKKDARLVLTDGIFNLLNEQEVITVVGHELGHIVHYDMIFMTAAQAVPLILYGIYQMTTSNDRSDNDNDKLAAVGYIAYILYLLSEYIILYLSRTREYYADAFSVEETKNPNALAEALVKIGFGLGTSPNAKKTSNALGIFDVKTSKSMIVSCIDNGKVSKDKIKNAMKWEMWNPWAKWFELNSTHPMISKRLLEISKYSEKYNQEPYVVFDLQKPESYVDDFFGELLLTILPTVVFVIAVFAFICSSFNRWVFLIGGFSTLLLAYIRFNRVYNNKNYKETTVSELLGEVKVSNITSIPCTLKGKIIGRGNPGCIFNEDFVIQDETGIIFLDYNQPIMIVNKLFALFKSKEYFDKEVKVTGWYRRSPVPYVEIKSMIVDGKEKKVWTYSLNKAVYLILAITIVVVTLFL